VGSRLGPACGALGRKWPRPALYHLEMHTDDAQLARPSLDTFLQQIYRDRSKLIFVFVGKDYEQKEWCGIDFRAIRQVINERAGDRVMYVRMDDGIVAGVLNLDGYVDARQYSPGQIAGFIQERISLI
jgi:hypothetical protein